MSTIDTLPIEPRVPGWDYALPGIPYMRPVPVNGGKHYVIEIPMSDGSRQYSAYAFASVREANAWLDSGGASILREEHKGAA